MEESPGSAKASYLAGFLRSNVGNGRNTVSRVLFRNRELTEFCGKLGEFCETLAHTHIG